MNIYIAPYKIGSESARTLARSLGALRTEGNKGYTYPSSIINWGKSDLNVWGRGVRKIYNRPYAVRVAASKLISLTTFTNKRVPTVEYTLDPIKAKAWLDQDGVVYGRMLDNSCQGRGIKVITADDMTFPQCPLYTRAILGGKEFRVHVAGTKVIDFTRKRRREGAGASEYIRNSNNGWVFCRQEEELPDTVAAASIMAVAALGLDFGACDVIIKDGKVAVLEVNTAPGIEGTSLTKYVEYFKDVL